MRFDYHFFLSPIVSRTHSIDNSSVGNLEAGNEVVSRDFSDSYVFSTVRSNSAINVWQILGLTQTDPRAFLNFLLLLLVPF